MSGKPISAYGSICPSEVDDGLGFAVFTDVPKQMAHDADVDLAVGLVDIAALRAFFEHWLTELELGEHWAQVGRSRSADQNCSSTMEGLDLAMA